MAVPLLQAKDIACSRLSNESAPVSILALSFECEPASLNLLWGSEASGSRLLLRILGLLEKPDAGEVFLHHEPTSHLSAHELAGLRSHRFGYLFPEPFLLPSLSVFENVAMPLFKISEVTIEAARLRTSEYLDFVGMSDCEEPIAGDLSRYDQHRVSLARALVNQPEFLIIEDLELPQSEMREFTKLVRTASARFGIAAIFSASDEWLVSRMDRVLEMSGMSHPSGAEP